MGLNVASANMWTLHWAQKDSGQVAFLSQSGGHAQFYVGYAGEFGIRFSKVISYGNALMMDSTDFLEYLATDPETKIITMYLEGVKDGKKLTELVREINPTKPVIIWKGGLTESGARAVASHTGSMAGEEAIWNAFFKQTGAVRVSKTDEMADVAMTFLYMAPPQGRRVAIIGGGGGNVVSAADVCAGEGLEVPVLTADTQAKLRKFIPPAGNSIRNPLDAEVVLRQLPLFQRTLEIVAADPLIDMLIVDQHLDRMHAEGKDQVKNLTDLMQQFAAKHGRQKPMAAILYTWGGDPEVRAERSRMNRELPRAGIPVYRSLPRASRALAKFAMYHQFQREKF